MWLGSGITVFGRLDSDSDSDQYTVFLKAGETYDFWVAGADTPDALLFPDTLPDPALEITGPNGFLISDVDTGEGYNDVLRFRALETGTYTIDIRESPAHPGAGGTYTLNFTDTSLDHDIPGHIFDAPPPGGVVGTDMVLAEGDVLVSEIGAPEIDRDVVAIHLDSNILYSFSLRGKDSGDGTLPDPELFLLDDDGNVVASNNDSGGTHNAAFTFNPGLGGGGNYFLVAESHGDIEFGTGGTYELRFGRAVVNFDVPEDDSTVFKVPMGGAVQGGIGASADTDWYAVELVAGQTYRFNLDSTDIDTELFLRAGESPGTILASDNDGGPGSNAQITFTAQDSGFFFLEAREKSGQEYGTFTLSATQLSAPPAPVHVIATLQNDGNFMEGSNLADQISGGDGKDTIEGDAGSDTIAGGDGDDFLSGGFFDEVSRDTVSGGVGNDLIFVAPAGGQIDGGTGNDTILGGDASSQYIGGDGNDLITAFNGNHTLEGGDGNDTMSAGDGTNQLYGGAGNDTFDFVDLGDNIGGGAGIDTVNAKIGYQLGSADLENLNLLGATNINGFGNALANTIFGNDGNNQIGGLAGDDVLNGGAGNDTITGGAGKDLNTGSGGLDTIKYNALSDSGVTFATRDAINTFAHGDKIDLSAIDANTGLAGNQAFTFKTDFTHHAGELQFDQVATNSFLITADVNGDAVADFSLNLYTAPGFGALQAWDFIL
jgi:Ca2+-binding RTX toxin-like protein